MRPNLGGDTVVTAVFTNGDTETIRANEGFYVGGGAALVDAARNIEVHLSLAYKFAVVDVRSVRVGGGLAYHISPRLEGSGVVGGLDEKFKNALGGVLQVDWRITEKIAAGLRYTILEYDAKGVFAGSAKSNGVGLTFSMNF